MHSTVGDCPGCTVCVGGRSVIFGAVTTTKLVYTAPWTSLYWLIILHTYCPESALETYRSNTNIVNIYVVRLHNERLWKAKNAWLETR